MMSISKGICADSRQLRMASYAGRRRLALLKAGINKESSFGWCAVSMELGIIKLFYIFNPFKD